MGKTAFIFPGQGSQYVGMGRRLWEGYEEVRSLYESASRKTGLDITSLSFEGPAEELGQDVAAQIAVFVCNEASRIHALRSGMVPQAVTGYSMGFYSALVAAGAVSFDGALTAVMRAGELALGQSRGRPGTMAAVIGFSRREVEGLCREVGPKAGVWVSNINAARQVLVSGFVDDVERLVTLALDRGALSAYRLDMGAAYHSPMMRDAAEAFREDLAGVSFRSPDIPVMSYIDARYMEGPADIRETVGSQLVSQVLWKETVLGLIKDGVDTFVEVGPGNALSRMVRWVDRGVSAVSIESIKGN